MTPLPHVKIAHPHVESRATMDGYVRHANLFRKNAGKGLL